MNLNKELTFIESIEDFTQAQEINKSIEFYKKIMETMRLEDLKKKHETNVQVTKNQLLREAKSIEIQFDQEMKKKKEEYDKEMENLEQQHRKQLKDMFNDHMKGEGLNLKIVPEIVEMDITLKKLVKEKKYADVKYLKRLKEQKERDLQTDNQHKIKEALRNKLAVLKAKQANEIKSLKSRLDEYMSEKKVKRDQSLAQHKKTSKVKLLNTCSSNIREFNDMDKKVRNSTMDNKKPVENKYKYYGSDIKTRSLLRSKQMRNTFVLDLIKKAN